MEPTITALATELHLHRQAWAANQWNTKLAERCAELTAQLREKGYHVDGDGTLTAVTEVQV